MTSSLDSVLDYGPISRVRRNHGLEHATIHVLSRQFPKTSIAGHSDTGGFWLFGDLETGQVEAGVRHALARLRAGEHDLAIHPNCGTNFVTSGAAAGLAAAFAMWGAGRRNRRETFGRLPLAVAFATFALILAQPLGFTFQKAVTTSGHPGDLEVVAVTVSQRGGMKAHRVTTRG